MSTDTPETNRLDPERHDMIEHARRLERERDALRAQLAATQEDSKRLDWLEQFLRMGGTSVSCDPTGVVAHDDFENLPDGTINIWTGHYSVGYQVETERGCYKWRELGGRNKRLRAAIDAATKEDKP